MSGTKLDHKWSPSLFYMIASRMFPASTAWYLQDITGISIHTVRKHLHGQRPNGDHVITYLKAGEFGLSLQRQFLNSNSEEVRVAKSLPLNAPSVPVSDLEKWGAYAESTSLTSLSNTG